MFVFRDTLEATSTDSSESRVDVAFTDSTLDLGEGPDADLQRLDDHLTQLGTACGTRIVRMHQVHGADVSTVSGANVPPPQADALVTTQTGVALMARAADCVPVLLADARAGVIGAVHNGRPGLVARVVPAAVARMRELGAAEITAWVGPHVCGRCYEVPATMREEVAALVPESFAETSWGTPSLDIGAGVRAQLAADAVQVVSIERCTREDPELHSYRRDGAAAGRLAGLIWRTP
ncbi:MAG: laccase [Nocardioides sp.]|uniref:peptidoglycan editing factor PgeF n=1 Tax=Nocardioides sp. TaxID=35761 RepID=UPI0026376930|nr:peptidoglycan editing factor PgeF [Nocardioides sp.]MCW2833481.1 laccase [Nocardioides sp.]